VRYRAAEESKDNRVTKNLKVYFVEKTDNSSSFREVKVNEYGAILDWPEGFFDQSPREAEDILKAAMKKRRAERKGGAQNG
jgi:predicted ATPase